MSKTAKKLALDLHLLSRCIAEKWWPMVFGGDIGICALCIELKCEQCPIFKNTGVEHCWGTPYYKPEAKASDKSRLAMLTYLIDLANQLADKLWWELNELDKELV